MSYFNQFTIEDHPFETFIPENARFLIIGSFPTHKRNYKSTFQFFYAGTGNMFWPVIGKVFRKTFEHSEGDNAVSERKEFLKERRIGITDMLLKCYRHQGRSQDHHLSPIKFNDIFSLLEQHKGIETIIFTGRQKIIGPLGLFETYCYQRDVNPPVLRRTTEKILEGSFTWKGKDFEILVPYSTSRTMIEEERTNETELVSMYSTCLT